MFRATVVFALALFAVTVEAQTVLNGQLQGTTYTSPTGAFSLPCPVLPALGGVISDNANVVTFKDEFSTLISIGAFPLDATERWELSTRGNRDYLLYFFANVIMPEFKREFPTMTIEGTTGTYLKTLADGALLTYVLLPGGSVFGDHFDPFDAARAPSVAKRGNLVFVQNGFTFVISTELAERVTEGTSYKKTIPEQNAILRKRLEDLVHSMTFPKPKPAATP